MGQYELIAFDMDGTLLDSNKEITEDSMAAIHKAAQAGKEVIICTGRAVAEVEMYCKQIPEVRYLVCLSGALVMDLQENQKIYSNSLSRDLTKAIIREGNKEDAFVHLLSVDSIVEAGKVAHLWDYTIGHYKPLFEKIGLMVDSTQDWFDRNDVLVEKVNISSRDYDAREQLRERLVTYPIEVVESEGTMLECSPVGVSKAVGLQALADHLGITTEQMIMVGDAHNDMEAMKAVGFSVAMGNAAPEVQAICNAVVSDNDHGGCVEAIEKYLLA